MFRDVAGATNYLNQNYLGTVATTDGTVVSTSPIEYNMSGDNLVFTTDPSCACHTHLAEPAPVKACNVVVPDVKRENYCSVEGVVTPATDAQIADYNNAYYNRHPEYRNKDRLDNNMYYTVNPNRAHYTAYGAAYDEANIVHY